MTHELIDVIIPAYNAEKYITETINSVLRQTYPVSKIYIIDDCSTDNTIDVINAIQSDKIVLLRNETNQGVSATRNAGLKAVTAPYIALVDADDVWEPTKLEKQMIVFQNSVYRPGVVYCAYRHINESGKEILSEMLHPHLRGDIFKQLLSGNFISGSASAILIKKDYTDQAGLFRTDLFYGEDWDYWLRLSKLCPFDFVDEALVSIRIHPQNVQHGQLNNPERLMKFLDQELKLIAPWSKEVRIPYPAYLRYFNRRYMLADGKWFLPKLWASHRYMHDFAAYHDKYFALSWPVMVLLAMRRSLRKLLRK